MDYFAGLRDVERGPRGTGHTLIALRWTDPLAHEYAAPLFEGGVEDIFLRRSAVYNVPVQRTRAIGHHIIMIVLEGRMAVVLGRRKEVLGPNMICILPAETSHRFSTPFGPATWIRFTLSSEPAWKRLKDTGARTRDYEFADHMYPLVIGMFRAYQSDSVADKHVGTTMSHAILDLLKYELSSGKHRPSTHVSEVESLFDRILSKPEDNWTVERMSSETGMPARSLTRHCKRVYGSTPLELVIRQRLRVACRMLSTSDTTTMDEIAECVGYSCGAALSTVFTRHMGVRPAKYRLSVRGDPTARKKAKGKNKRPHDTRTDKT